jgi:hypothetical protein
MNAPSGSMITDTRDPFARRNNNSRRHFNFDNWTSAVKREIKDLLNLGQFMSKKLAEIGITSENELRKIGSPSLCPVEILIRAGDYTECPLGDGCDAVRHRLAAPVRRAKSGTPRPNTEIGQVMSPAGAGFR